MWEPRKTRVRFQDQMRQPFKSLKSPRKETYPSKWTSWDNLKPAED